MTDAEANFMNRVVKLLSGGQSIDAQDNVGNTLLHYEVWVKNKGNIRKLLELGARIDIENYSGLSPLDYDHERLLSFEEVSHE